MEVKVISSIQWTCWKITFSDVSTSQKFISTGFSIVKIHNNHQNMCRIALKLINVFHALSRNKVFRPFFLQRKTINRIVYLNVLGNFLISQINNVMKNAAYFLCSIMLLHYLALTLRISKMPAFWLSGLAVVVQLHGTHVHQTWTLFRRIHQGYRVCSIVTCFSTRACNLPDQLVSDYLTTDWQQNILRVKTI